MKDEGAAEEAYGRASLLAVEKYALYAETICNPRAWLIQLVTHTCINLLRAQRREQVRWRVMAPLWAEEPYAPSIDSPEELYLRRHAREEVRRRLRIAFKGLPERLRRPVVLRLVLGKEYSVIAERLGITEETARKRVQLGRERLRERLAGRLEDSS